ncbi:Hypothetical protein c1367 [Escherichia coli CFT073]|uniref:Uncharacterized protein n=1 Tax=Escherichia coli O6:H1 (strain CFT073 / ATCC 700928 / UPEC) TaxID=199310 RepID=A0A0H2V6E0_ECOL6|nr:Hypothetical protein c1367 [Escherichia coli CFT073]
MSARISHEKSVIDNLVIAGGYWVSPLVWASGRFAILPTANCLSKKRRYLPLSQGPDVWR